MSTRTRSAASTPRQRPNGAKRRPMPPPVPKRSPKRAEARGSSRVARRAEADWWPAFRETLRPGLERDTELMPWLIAETVCDEVSRFLDEPLPDRYAGWLDAKAERCYANNSHFRKLMRGQGNAPRDRLLAYMRHWLAAFLDLERPDLYQCLPEGFNLGHRLPVGAHPRIRRKGCGPTLLSAARAWDAQRVLRHRRWAWLAQHEAS
jgi:hypothetical protein